MPSGSGSESVTSYAVPVPAAFELETVMSKAIGSPALTGEATAVLTTVTSGHWIVTEALAWSEPSLPAVTLAVLLTTPQLTGADMATTWTPDEAPETSDAAV
jgi:hypothetical protein